MRGPVAFVLKGYPRLSETFIANEIRALERRGLDIRIVSLRHPTETARHPVHDEIIAPVLYLPEYLRDEPRRVLSGLRSARRLAGFTAALRAWLKDLVRDRTANRVRRFGQAAVLAAELPAGIGHLHAHFLHTPASVTRYAAIMAGLDWSVSAHAKDIWTTPAWEKIEKLAHCAWLVTCSQAAGSHLAALAPDPDRVSVVYHGLDPERFPPPPARAAQRRDGRRDGRREGTGGNDPVRLLAVARAVEKKGLDVLLKALARLPGEVNWRLTHIGGGAERGALRNLAVKLGIDARIDWRGACAQAEVLEAYRTADLFVLPSRVARSGDRDGLPNVLLEAQSQGLACLASREAAIPELIEDGKNGILVPPDDVAALAGALQALIADPLRREGLGRAGMERVRAMFGFADGVGRLAARFGLTDDDARAACARAACAPTARAPTACARTACTSLSTRR